jgi:hypothetical protein
MENLYYNLSEEEFSKGKKMLLWGFAGFFLFAAMYVLYLSLLLNKHDVPAVLSAVPLGISLFVSLVAAFASAKKKENFFSIDENKIEFCFGLFRPKKQTFKWSDIRQLILAHKQRKAMLVFNDGSSYVIDLTWLQKKKSNLIRKHIYHAACEKEIKIEKVSYLKRN